MKTPVSGGQMIDIIEKIAQQWDCCEYDSHDGMIDIGDAIRRAGFPMVNASLSSEAEGWQDIATAPLGREMFVVKAFDACNGFTGGKPYTSDPWCVWQDEPGKFLRWPHNFPPTHWMPLAKAPAITQESKQ